MAQEIQAAEEMSVFLELLIELAALERLRHAWGKEAVKSDQWRMKFEILNDMISRRLQEREDRLKDFESAYPELKGFDWFGSSEKTQQFDA